MNSQQQKRKNVGDMLVELQSIYNSMEDSILKKKYHLSKKL